LDNDFICRTYNYFHIANCLTNYLPAVNKKEIIQLPLLKTKGHSLVEFVFMAVKEKMFFKA